VSRKYFTHDLVSSSVDIIANKFLRQPAVNSKVVQSTGDLHHKIVILFFRISEKVLDNSTSFNPTASFIFDMRVATRYAAPVYPIPSL
jgi:hypothetical protein